MLTLQYSIIKRFVVVLYDKNSSASKVNATRELFTKKGQPLTCILLTQMCKFTVEYEFFYDQVSTQLFPGK